MLKLTRRELLKATAASGVMTTAGVAPALIPATASAAPKRGGKLRIGLKGANTSDTWDGRTHSDSYMINMAQGCVFECLTEVKSNGELVGELAKDWEASADAKTWTFNLRRGVRFHNGKSFGADDVIESFQMHVAEGAKSAAKPIVSAVQKMTKMSDYQVQFTLKSGNADFPYLVSDYHILIYPAGMIDEAIANGIGTGPYQVVSFDPGVRTVVKRVGGHHHESTGGWFDEIEAIAISDDSARTTALVTNQVDAINNLDKRSIPLVSANPAITILEVTGNQHYTFPMLTYVSPFNDVNVRKAVKYGVNRQELVDKILLGHGAVANDHPIGPANQYHAGNFIPQTEYDPDKSKYYLKLAGMSSLKIDLSASNAAFNGAIDAAQLYQNSARASGIMIDVIQEPADGYWSNVWLKKPWSACYWSGRATEDWMFSTAYEIGVPWNDTSWYNYDFQRLLLEGRVELNTARRRNIYYEMQRLCSEEGGVVIPMYANYIDAHSNKLAHGEAVGNLWTLDNSRICKRWWFA